MTWEQFVSFFQFAAQKDKLHGESDAEDRECTADGTLLIKQFEAWRKTQPALTWTTEKPTKEGWYWLRSNAANPGPLIVFVQPQYNAIGPWGDRSDSRLSEEDGEWAGPLEPPK